MNKKLVLFSIITASAFSLAVFQYVKEFQSELASAAYSGKPAMGHSWSEMECSQGLCVTTDNKVGIGTSTPGSKLDVAGTINSTGNISSSGTISATGNISSSGAITAGTDVCNGAGACLSQLNSFVGSQPLMNSVHSYSTCTSAGGQVTNIGTSFPICKFSGSSCPSGWTQYQNYMKRTSDTFIAAWSSETQCSYFLQGNDFSNVPWTHTVNYVNLSGYSCRVLSASCSCWAWGGPVNSCDGVECFSFRAAVTEIGCY